MLNSELKITKKEGNNFKPLPKNIYDVELLDINQEERPTYDTRNEEDSAKEYETILNFQFTLLAGRDGEDDLRGRNVWANFIPVYLYVGKNGKNKLYRIIEAILGRDLTLKEEANGISGDFLNSLISKQLRVSVESKPSGDKVFDNITDFFSSVGDERPALTAEEREKATVNKDESKEVTVDDIDFSSKVN